MKKQKRQRIKNDLRLKVNFWKLQWGENANFLVLFTRILTEIVETW